MPFASSFNRNADMEKKRLARQEHRHRDSMLSTESVETTRTISSFEDGSDQSDSDQSAPHHDWMAPLAQMNVPTGVPLRDLAGTPSSKRPKKDLRRGDDVHPCMIFGDIGNEYFDDLETFDDDLLGDEHLLENDLFLELIVTDLVGTANRKDSKENCIKRR